MKLPIRSVAILVVAVSAAAAALASRAPLPGAAAAVPTDPLAISSVIPVGESVVVDVKGSFLDTVVLADGQRVRPIAVRAVFEIEGGHGLAEVRVHVLRPAGGDAMLDLSVRGVDVTLHDLEASAPLLRDCAVHLRPVPGRSWGEIASEEHLALSAVRL
jgi:hypothetical protein